MFLFSLFNGVRSASGRVHHNRELSPFMHTIVGPDGTRVCEPGYISDKIIDKRGCWQCDVVCNGVSECSYPGICVTKVPVIKSSQISTINSTKMAVINYEIPDFEIKSNPRTGFCNYDGEVVFASKITKNQIFCKIFPERYSVTISFDKQSWSGVHDIVKGIGMSGFGQAIVVFVVVVIVIAICVLIVAYLKSHNVFPKRRIAEPSISKPLAYFPTVDDGEKKVPYY